MQTPPKRAAFCSSGFLAVDAGADIVRQPIKVDP
jgi:hypothetical protein